MLGIGLCLRATLCMHRFLSKSSGQHQTFFSKFHTETIRTTFVSREVDVDAHSLLPIEVRMLDVGHLLGRHALTQSPK